MLKKILNFVPAILGALVVGAAALLLYITVMNSGLLPDNYLTITGVVLAILPVICGLFMLKPQNKVRFIIGAVLVVLFVAVMLTGCFFVKRGLEVLETVTKPGAVTTVVDVYVKKDDDAKKLKDTKNYVYGILASLDREYTDAAIEEVEAKLGKKPNLKEYDGADALIQALMVDGEVQAIIIPAAQFDVLVHMQEELEIPEEELYDALTRKLHTTNVVEQTTTGQRPSSGGAISDHLGREELPILTIYLSGIDSRSGMPEKSRSDVNIIAIINPNTYQVLMISVPRDYYVPLKRGSTTTAPDKLTHAGIYGVQVSMDTLSLLLGTKIDHYFRVNFSGFEKIVDAVGGVTVVSDYAFTASCGGYKYVKGENQLNGKRALSFARERKSFASGDRQRGKNQMILIKAIAEKAMSPVILTNFNEIMNSIESSFRTTISKDTISKYVRMQLRKNPEWEFISYSLDGSGASRKCYSMSIPLSVMIPNEKTVNKAKSMIQSIMNNEIIVQ